MARVFTPTDAQQLQILLFMKEQGTFWDDQLQVWNNKMLDIYREYSTFVEPKQAAWQTTFKVNKAFQIVNQVLPRVMAQSPTWIVSVNGESFTKDFQGGDNPDSVSMTEEKLAEYAEAIQDYLTYVFNKKHLKRALRQWAKNMIIYGQAWAKIRYKYDITRDVSSDVQEGEDENGNPLPKKKITIDENVSDEYVTIEVKKFEDMKYDPRYVDPDDMSGIIDVTRGLRLSQFTKNKEKYINTDKLIGLAGIPWNSENTQDYRQRVLAITGIQNYSDTTRFDKNNLVLSTYQGLFGLDDDEDGTDEKLYEFQVINDLVVVSASEITQIDYEEIRAFEDTETNFATGFVEQIMGLQKEMNFKKNSASTYINQALNRNWIWSPQSGIDPRKLTSQPGNIIVATQGGKQAEENCYELPFRQIAPDYFQEENDFERQIQGLTFTVDTSNQQNQQALTNTATGIRVKAFESNSVMEEITQHFEEGMQNLAYKLLQKTFEEIDDNIDIKKSDGTGYWQMHKVMLKDAIKRYDIKVDAGSSSYDSEDNQRDDAIAAWNIGLQAKQAGVPNDLTSLYKNVMGTFQGINPNKLIVQASPLQGIQPPAQPGVPQPPIPTTPPVSPNPAAALTNAVAGGKVTQ